jgi:hypothetical protein
MNERKTEEKKRERRPAQTLILFICETFEQLKRTKKKK